MTHHNTATPVVDAAALGALDALAGLYGTRRRLQGRLQAAIGAVGLLGLVMVAGLRAWQEPSAAGVAVVVGGAAAGAAGQILARRLGRGWPVALLIEVGGYALVLVGSGAALLVPLAAVTFTAFHSLFTARLRTIAAVVAFTAMLTGVAAAAVLSLGAHAALSPETVLGGLLTAAGTAVAGRLIVRTVRDHQHLAEREGFVAQATSAVLGAEDREGMFAALLGTLDQLIGERADLRVRVLTGDRSTLVVRAATAGWSHPGVGMRIPVDRVPERLTTALRSLKTLELSGAEAHDVYHGLRFAGSGQVGGLLAVPLTVDDEWGLILVAGEAALPRRVVESLVAIGAQVRLGLARVRLQENLEATERWYRSLVEHSAGITFLTDADGHLAYASPSIRQVLGFEPWQILGRNILSLVDPEDASQMAELVAEVRDGKATAPFESRLRAADGGWVPVESVATNLLSDAAVRGLVFNTRDIRDRRALQRRLEKVAFHDDLTGLANRSLLVNRLSHALNRLAQFDEPVTLLAIDIHAFSDVNDRFGTTTGDRLLVGVAERLQACVRQSDTLARVDADEFAIVIGGPHRTAEVIALARQIIDTVRRPFVVGQHEIVIDVSVGIAAAQAADADPQSLLREAELALEEARRVGPGSLETFQPEMHAAIVERLEIADDLRHVVERGELEVHYQPIVDLANGQIVKAEALVRWRHATRGAMSPALWIPLAEQNGTIHSIGGFVLREACRVARRLFDDHPELEIQMSVNLSGRQLDDPLLVDEVASALRDAALPAHLLLLEITESVVMEHLDVAVERLVRLRELGVKLAIDDFGTGYSSLAQLKRLPVDLLKIDRSFIDGVPSSQQDTALVRTVVQLAEALDLQTVAEGIERNGQLSSLASLGCTFGQGWLFGKPVDGPSFSVLVHGTAAGGLVSQGE